MADNVAITAGSGTTIAADDVGGGVLVQRVKATWGPDGTANDTDVATGKPMPTQLRVSDGTAWTYGAGATAAGTPRVTLASDSAGVTTLGQAVMASSLPVAIASNQSSVPVTPADQYAQYETVAASQSAQAMGASGATGDYLAGVLVFPGTAGCGVVTILDNAVPIGTFAGGGTTALPSLVPFLIPVGLFSVSGAWKITTGANVTAVGIGKFT